MKRKVIQIAESTQLVSLPRKWCLANKIKKGDELEVNAEGTTVTISCDPGTPTLEIATLNIKDFGVLSRRVIHALYKKGVDEIIINFEKPSEIELVQSALRNETVGYEIVEQKSRKCVIKNISSNIMGFDTMLRRTFLLLISLAEETANLLQKKDFAQMKTLISLEESNNRFTTLCRRYLNKYGAPNNQKVGPFYSIIEELEKIADEYKYLIKALTPKNTKDVKINTYFINSYGTLLEMMKDFYDAFYQFDAKKVAKIGAARKKFVSDMFEKEQVSNFAEFALMHHSLVIMQKLFALLGPLLIMKSVSDQVDQ